MSEGIVIVSICGAEDMNKKLLAATLAKEFHGQQVLFEERGPMELSLHNFDYHIPEEPFFIKKTKNRRRGQRHKARGYNHER